MAFSDWVESDVWQLLSKHVTSCIGALLAFGLLGMFAFYIFSIARWVGWFNAPDAMVEAEIGLIEVVVLSVVFATFSAWFIVDLYRLRIKKTGGHLFEVFLVA
jgi:hypothetical protein